MSQSPASDAAPFSREAAPSPGVVWLDAQMASPAAQLALDEALLEEAHEGRCTGVVVRCWMAGEPVVVLGSSSRVEEEVDSRACAEHGVAILRRPSGGATVLLGPGCLMWSVITHHAAGPPAIECIHAAMLVPLAAALGTGAADRVVRRGLSDLAIQTRDGERKVSGNALRVRRHGVLYHGTLLDGLDLALVSQVLRHPPREPEYRERRPHAAFLANLGLGRERVEQAVRDAFGAWTVRTHWPAQAVERLVRERYADPAWTFKM